MPQDVLIKADELSRSYGSLRAVQGLSFELRRGEILGLLGPNGAGKSTTMQMVCGCLAPSSGRIEIAGLDLLQRPTEAKRHLGYLPEQPPLYPELTVNEFLRFCARLHRLAPPGVAAAVDRVLQTCGLEASAARQIGHLSKGMQQRVGIAQALVHDPAVVILDEPTVGLDPLQIREIRSLIVALGREHAVLLSSHILPEVEAVCGRVLILHQGSLAYDAALDSASSGDWLRLGLANPPPADRLLALQGVSDVRAEAGGSWLVRTDAGAGPARRAEWLEHAVEQGWRPYLLAPQPSNLEQVFIELTTGAGQP